MVTGGGTGIGRAVAEELLRRGLDVVITGRREDVPAGTADGIGARAVMFDAADPAAAVAFLASPEAGHVTGQVLPVNGGAHLGR